MAFEYYPLTLVEPDFSHALTDLILDLDRQRHVEPAGTTPPAVFLQLKRIFHLLESLGSARIEGNRTTLARMVEKQIEEESTGEEAIREIVNLERALLFLDDLAAGPFMIDHRLIRHLHILVTRDLSADAEGASDPGEYRKGEVHIAGASHTPPPADRVFTLMDELLTFYNRKDAPKYDLLKIALAHHRFAWIHPFSNGNGRTVRLLTYAMLLKSGFRVGGMGTLSRILNPTAVFCSNRDAYYDNLTRADTGSREGLLGWCLYVFSGLKEELIKIDRLLDYEYLKEGILLPALEELHRKNGISDNEFLVLRLAVEKKIIQNRDVRPVLGNLSKVQTSRILSELKKTSLLISPKEAERKYIPGLTRNVLTREVMRRLDREGFLPLKDEI